MIEVRREPGRGINGQVWIRDIVDGIWLRFPMWTWELFMVDITWEAVDWLDDNELPGMWQTSDFINGETDV